MFSLFLCLVSAESCSNSPSGTEWGITIGSPWTPSIDCYIDNQESDVLTDNLIHTYLGVSTYTECQLLCEDQYPCVAFTHFDRDGHPFPEGCLLFSSYQEQRACQNCTTGSSQTECRCSIAYAGDATPDNFVDLIGSVSDEHVCNKMCITDNQCDMYIRVFLKRHFEKK